MEMKIIDAYQLAHALRRLEQIEMPTRGAYAVLTNSRRLKEIATQYETERMACITEYGEARDGEVVIENDQYKIANQDLFDEAMSELCERIVEVDLAKISLDDLPRTTTAIELEVLEPILTQTI